MSPRYFTCRLEHLERRCLLATMTGSEPPAFTGPADPGAIDGTQSPGGEQHPDEVSEMPHIDDPLYQYAVARIAAQVAAHGHMDALLSARFDPGSLLGSSATQAGGATAGAVLAATMIDHAAASAHGATGSGAMSAQASHEQPEAARALIDAVILQDDHLLSERMAEHRRTSTLNRQPESNEDAEIALGASAAASRSLSFPAAGQHAATVETEDALIAAWTGGQPLPSFTANPQAIAPRFFEQQSTSARPAPIAAPSEANQASSTESAPAVADAKNAQSAAQMDELEVPTASGPWLWIGSSLIAAAATALAIALEHRAQQEVREKKAVAPAG